MPNDAKNRKEQLLEIVRKAAQKDEELRLAYQVKDKFRFIRDRIHSLIARVEENLATLNVITDKKQRMLAADESLVYIYLFNAQGMNLQTWQKMLHPSVFYEHSVNRPIYGEKSFIDAIIRSKANKQQHAYITIAVKKNDILEQTEIAKDLIGNPLIRVREGALHADRMMGFTHNNTEYTFEEGIFNKK